ncbi:MAG: hypothetical protein D3926_16980 [Desulfobacteraceae bacterium]|nr:MAG: hypothetical protein D3926_16980 [Desulfobacteraceae bacterium]
MGAEYDFEKAVSILHQLTPGSHERLKVKCLSLRQAQETLLSAAGDAMHRCLEQCRGICCQNLDIDSIFSVMDFVYILTMIPQMEMEIRSRFNANQSIYRSACPFLIDQEGPCIFPNGIKAQECVITFCTNDDRIKPFIRKVNTEFFNLFCLVLLLRSKEVLRAAGRVFRS